MMKALRVIIFAAAALLIAVPASAQIQEPVYTPASPPDTEHLTWYQTQPYGPNTPITMNGVYYGPYSATLASYPGIPFIDIFCIDMAHNAITGSSGWDAWFTPVVRGGNYDYTRHPTAERGYLKGAYFASQFQLDNRAEWAGLHAALWNIFTPGHWRLSGYESQIAFWDGQWLANARSFNAQGWHVVTHAVDGQLGRGQEFLTYVTPEPETIFLLGTGLVAVIGVAVVTRRSIV